MEVVEALFGGERFEEVCKSGGQVLLKDVIELGNTMWVSAASSFPGRAYASYIVAWSYFKMCCAGG